MHELSGSPPDGGTAHIQPARAGIAAAAAAITVKYKDQSTKKPIPRLSRWQPRHLGDGDFTDCRIDLGPSRSARFLSRRRVHT